MLHTMEKMVSIKATTGDYDIIVLDINLPEIGGFDICRRIREKSSNIWIIMLTSVGENENIVAWLELGADDYLVKPFEYSILLARMKAIVRRNMQTKCTTIVEIGDDIVVDLQKIEVKKDGEEIMLSKLEFKLLKYFIENKWLALSRSEIYRAVLGRVSGWI